MSDPLSPHHLNKKEKKDPMTKLSGSAYVHQISTRTSDTLTAFVSLYGLELPNYRFSLKFRSAILLIMFIVL